MSRHHSLKTVIMCSALVAAVASGACGRDDPSTPVTEVQSQASQPTNSSVTVSGCLLAGEAENTFVLTAARSEGSAESATYQLVGGPQENLREQLGQRVRVSGTLEMREAAVAQTVATPAGSKEEPATGTTGGAGTPTVQTRTDVAINRLTVESVAGLGEQCGL